MFAKKGACLKCKLFGLLLLLFNCVCTAAPALESTFTENAEIFLITQNFSLLECEKEILADSYTIRSNRSYSNYLSAQVSPQGSPLKGNVTFNWQQLYCQICCYIPKPYYYSFLFRYKPF